MGEVLLLYFLDVGRFSIGIWISRSWGIYNNLPDTFLSDLHSKAVTIRYIHLLNNTDPNRIAPYNTRSPHYRTRLTTHSSFKQNHSARFHDSKLYIYQYSNHFTIPIDQPFGGKVANRCFRDRKKPAPLATPIFSLVLPKQRNARGISLDKGGGGRDLIFIG